MGRWREVVGLAPGRPAVMLGVRTALASVAPLVLAPWLPVAAVSWAVLGGFMASVADKGGSYGTRGRTMAGVTVGVALAALVATPAGGSTLAAVPLMFVWATLCGFAGVLGTAAAGPGTAIAVAFAVALAWPGSAATGLVRALAALGGGGFATALALLLWPVRVYRPARFAVGRCYRAVATQVAAICGLPGAERLAAGHNAVRTALETARGVLAATRRGRFGESARGARLLVLLQVADLIFAAVVALEEVLEGADPAHAATVAQALDGVAATLVRIAEGVESEQPLPAATAPAWKVDDPHAAALLERIRLYIQIAFDSVASLYDQREVGITWVAPPATDLEAASPAQRVRDQISPDSLLARHALRVGVTAAAATAIVRALGLERGYWVTVTVLIVLQPYVPATTVKALQRVAGTVLGGVLAALLVTYVHDPRVLVGIFGVLAGVSAAILQLNYALYSSLLTPTFVLLAEMSTQDWHLAEVRIANTLLGGALAFLGARFLWPHAEERRFPEEMAQALTTLAGYLGVVVHVLADDVPAPSPELIAARRRLGLALNAADASFQRLLAERSAGPTEQEANMTLLLYARRLAGTLGAAASTRNVASAKEHSAALGELGAALGAALEDLAEAVRRRREPAPLPEIESIAARIDTPLIGARIGRVAQQLTVLHQAVLRWLPARATRP